MIGVLSLCIGSAVQARNMLEDVSFASIPGDKVQVVLHFTEAAPQPRVFTIDSPSRIALDLPETALSLAKKRQTIGIGLVRSIAAVSSGERTRVVLNLVSLTSYAAKIDGNNIIITLNEAAGSGRAAANAADRNSVKDIDFRLGDAGEANIILSFAQQPETINMKQELGKLVINIENMALPGDLERRLDVKDFNTPVSFIDTFASASHVKMVVDTQGEFEHLGYQTGQTFTIEIKGLTKEQKQARQKAKFGFSGERLSLNFQDIEVRAVLQLIADFTGKNMVTSDTVSGSITLRLKNVPWDQALDIILKTKGLGMREDGNVMRVAPAEELAAIEKQELEAKKQIADLLPLVTETIQLQFVPASSVVALLDKIGDAEASNNQLGDISGGDGDDNEGASYVSSRATIVADDRTNKLIVRDTARNIAQLRGLIEEIDTPTRQVLIDARVVSASDKFEKDLGLNWKFGSTNNAGDLKDRGFPSTTQTTDGIVDLGNTQKNLLGITFALLNSSYLVDLEISASQTEGTSELISSPRVVTTNGEKASIKAGKEIPYQTVDNGGAPSIEFKDAVLSLEVTPLIIPGNKVHMKLKINKDEIDDLVPVGIVGSAPSIATREIETSVLVDNGDTIVLGGIFEHDRSQQTDSVPILGDIPVIGAAFRVNNNRETKTELIIFITPKIMDETLSVR